MGVISEGVDILKLVNKAQNAELYKQIGEWIDKVGTLQRANEDLVSENRVLKDSLQFRGVLERINGHVFVMGDDEEICPRCAEVDFRLVHLIPQRSKSAPFQKAACPSCKTEMLHNLPYTRDLAITR